MLVLFGSEKRTVEEFQALYDAAGLRLTRLVTGQVLGVAG
jgi:hypothetical protein